MFIHPVSCTSRDFGVSWLQEPGRTKGQEGERGRIATLTTAPSVCWKPVPRLQMEEKNRIRGDFPHMETPWEAELTQLVGAMSEEHSVRLCGVKR